MGTAVFNFLLGGPEVGQTTLRNFYAIHVAVLPAIMILAMSYHFWRVRKDGGIALLPQLDPQEDNIGHYFRSRKGRFAALFGVCLRLLLVPLTVILDEYWLDLPGLLPAWPTLITTGLIPLLATLAMFALIYFYFRAAGKLNHSESLVGLFAFIMTSFVELTFIGIFFRGANMALVWPF